MIIRGGVTLAVAGFAIFFFCSEGWGADWADNFANENFIYLYDQENIEALSADILRVWQRWVPLPKKVKEMVQEDGLRYANWDHTLFLTEIDCGKGLQRILQFTEYDTSGNVAYTEAYSDSSWIFIIPGSVGEALSEAICPKRQGI